MKPLGATAISTESSDEQLVTMAQSGSSEAFASLFRRYRPAIARYAGRMLGDDARAEDVVQEVFLSALRSLDTLDRPAGFRPWLYRIAHNSCVDHARRRGRTQEVHIDPNRLSASEEIRLFRQAPSTHAALAQKQSFEHLREAFGGLPPSQSEVLVMRELEGLSYDQIAGRMGVSRGSVESMLFRARQGLRDEYGQIETGERCVRIRPVMARTAEGLGSPRDRRALARHVHGCQACRRDAIAMGLSGPALDATLAGGVRAGLSRVAALLPLPWFIGRRPEDPSGATTAAGGSGSAAVQAQTAVAQLGSSMGVGADHAATALQKAVAVVAAVAVVGGGGFAASKGDRGGELLLKPDSEAVPARADVGPAVPPGLATLQKNSARGEAHAGVTAGPGTRAVLATPLAAPNTGGPVALKAPVTPHAGSSPAAPPTTAPAGSEPGGDSGGGTSGGDPVVPAAGDTGTGTGKGGGTPSNGGGTTGGGSSPGGGTDPTTGPGGGATTPLPGDPAAPPCLPKGLAKKNKVPPGHARKGCVPLDAVTEPVP